MNFRKIKIIRKPLTLSFRSAYKKYLHTFRFIQYKWLKLKIKDFGTISRVNAFNPTTSCIQISYTIDESTLIRVNLLNHNPTQMLGIAVYSLQFTGSGEWVIRFHASCYISKYVDRYSKKKIKFHSLSK